MAIDRPLNPKILSLAFNEQLICDISSAFARYERGLGLSAAAPLFRAAIRAVITNEPPNTIHHVRTIMLFFIFSYYLADVEVRDSVLLPLLAHVADLPPWASNLLNNELSKHFSVRAQMLALGAAALKEITSARGFNPYDEASYQGIRPLLALISRLHRANLASIRQIPEGEFKSESLAARLKASKELTALLRKRTHSYFEFHEVLPTGFKIRALKLVLRHHKRGDFCLPIDRKCFVPDILEKLRGIKPEVLKRGLRVEFVGERALDCGGPRREFFTMGGQQLFSPHYSMFQVVRDKFYWFTVNSFEAPETYEILGTFVGLAMFNQSFLPIRFPKLLYKKLLHIPLTTADVAELDEEMAANMQQVYDYREEGNNVEDLGLVFAITDDYFGQASNLPFFDGGEDTPVKNDDIDRYMEYRINFVLGWSVQAQYEAFERGFLKCCAHPIFQKFTPAEFDLIVSGEEVYDWEELKAGTRYRGYKPKDKPIVWFWDVFDKMTEEQKRQLLVFSIGSDCNPIGGLRALAFRIDRGPDQQDQLPTAHTCFNTLVLPSYRDRATLESKLLFAITNTEGFAKK
jgi:ubiquitin-protein ligase E3 A